MVNPLRGIHGLPVAGGFAVLVTTQKLRLSGIRERTGAKHVAFRGGLEGL
jgi:hypothetical protein